jgi:hypothetical protein
METGFEIEAGTGPQRTDVKTQLSNGWAVARAAVTHANLALDDGFVVVHGAECARPFVSMQCGEIGKRGVDFGRSWR